MAEVAVPLPPEAAEHALYEPQPASLSIPQVLTIRYLQESPFVPKEKNPDRFVEPETDPLSQKRVLQVQNIQIQALLGDFPSAKKTAKEIEWYRDGHQGYLAVAKAAAAKYPDNPTLTKHFIGLAKRRATRMKAGGRMHMSAIIDIAEFEMKCGFSLKATLDAVEKYEKESWGESFYRFDHINTLTRFQLYQLRRHPPRSNADREKLANEVKERIEVLEMKEQYAMEDLLPVAEQMVRELAYAVGLDKMEGMVSNFPYLYSFLVGYIGLAQYAAETDSPDLPRLLTVVEKKLEKIRYFKGDKMSSAVFSALENLTLDIAYVPDALEDIDIGMDFMSGDADASAHALKKANNRMTQCLSLRQAAHDFLEYANKCDDSSEKERLTLHAQRLNILADHMREEALTSISGVMNKNFNGSPDYVWWMGNSIRLLGFDGVAVGKLYQDLYDAFKTYSQNQKQKYEVRHRESEERLQSIMYEAYVEEKDSGHKNLISDLVDSGFYSFAYELAFQIEDEFERRNILNAILIADLEKRDEQSDIHNVTSDSLVEISQNPYRHRIMSEAVGKFSNLSVEGVLAHPLITNDVKISFLVGQAQRIETKNETEVSLSGKMLKKAVDFIHKQNTFSERDIQVFIDGLISTQNYDIAVTFLFALMNHSKANDYATMTEFSPFTFPTVLGLLRLKNQKGIAIISQLFANPSFSSQGTQFQETLFNVMVKYGAYPPELGAYFKKKVKAGFPKQTLLEFFRYMINTHKTHPSLELLHILIPDGKVPTLDKLKNEILRIYATTDQYETVMYPPELLSNISATGGMGGYYLRHIGDRNYGYSYPYETFQRLITTTADLKVDQGRYQEFADHLVSSGYSSTEVGIILNQLELGIYPFGEDWPYPQTTKKTTFEFVALNDIEYEIQTTRQEIDKMRNETLFALSLCKKHNINPSSLEDAVVKAQDFDDFFDTTLRTNWTEAYDLFTARNFKNRENIPISEIHHSAALFMLDRHGLYSSDTLISDFLTHFDLLFEQLGQIESRRAHEAQAKRNYKATILQKGQDFFRFARVVDAVAECVNSTHEIDHVAYMARRLADPLSFAVELADAETGKVIGNVEMRTGKNEKTGSFELFVVGIYSSGKNKSFCNQVMHFVEQNIARPLRMKAINIAGLVSGSKDLKGYKEIQNLKSVSYSPVAHQNGESVRARGDDIYSGDPNDPQQQWKNNLDHNAPFPFNGYRKELKYGFARFD